MQLRLRSMSDEEFAQFRSRAIDDYARAQVDAGEWDSADAHEQAESRTSELLPDGLQTPGMRLLVAETPEATLVGYVWISLGEPQRRAAWIYDIEVVAGERGKGYGRALLAAAEELVRDEGIATMGLNVFGENSVARRLYETSGYETTSLHMRKELR